MKKTTLLSLATTAAVLVTTVGTFAAFDTLSASNQGEGAVLDFGTPVTVAMNVDAGDTSVHSLGEAPSVTTTATVTVENQDSLGEKITLSFDLAGTDGTNLTETADYTLDVKANASYLEGSSSVFSGTLNTTFEDMITVLNMAF